MKLYPFGKRGLHRSRFVRAIRHAERNAARLLCLRWARGEVTE